MIAIIGASGRLGASVCRALAASGDTYRPIVRNPANWRALGLPGIPECADMQDAQAMTDALVGATKIISCAHARFTSAVLAAAPAGASFVLMGSTRRFSRWPDEGGDGVRAGERAFIASGRSGVMLHPTMIYGAAGEDNVQRLAALLRRLPIAPLPDGGRALVQPILVDDVTRCILAALHRSWQGPQTLVIAGPRPMQYRDFMAQVARASGLRPPPVLPVPTLLLRGLARLTPLLPMLPTIRAAEIRRLTEDKNFDIGPMLEELDVQPVDIEEGLARSHLGNQDQSDRNR